MQTRTQEYPSPSHIEALLSLTTEILSARSALLLQRMWGTGMPQILARSGFSPPQDCLPQLAQWVMAQGRPFVLFSQEDSFPFPHDRVSPLLLPLAGVSCGASKKPLGALLFLRLEHCTPETVSRGHTLLPLISDLAGSLLLTRSLEERLKVDGRRIQRLASTAGAERLKRENLLMDLHDSTAQTLTATYQYLQLLGERLPPSGEAHQLALRSTALLKDALKETRQLINEGQLQPTPAGGLARRLQEEIQRLRCDDGWEVELNADAPELPQQLETTVFRIAHEAITNARKHSQGNQLKVDVNALGNRLVLRVKDNGRGFSVADANGKGVGLYSMQRRAERAGGYCQVHSDGRRGTTVVTSLPVKPRSKWNGSTS